MAGDCRGVLFALDAPKINLAKSKFDETMALAELSILSSMDGITEELVALNTVMLDLLESSESLKAVTSSDLDQEKVEGIVLKNLHAKHGSTQDGAKFYVTFNKTRALRGLAEKFFKDAEDIFGQSNAKSLCQKTFDSVNIYKGKVETLDLQKPERAIANLTCLTSLFRNLQTGETRNLFVQQVT